MKHSRHKLNALFHFGPVKPMPMNSKLGISHNLNTFQSQLHQKASRSFATPSFVLVTYLVTMVPF